MSIWGKLIGGAAGLALGGPLGAIFGAAAGAAVDAMVDTDRAANRRAEDKDSQDATHEIAFTVGVIVLGAKMAKADGVVTRDEVAAFKQVFRVPREEEANVGRIFNIARTDALGFEPHARQLAQLLAGRPKVLENLVYCLFHIAKADGTVTAEEIEFLRRVSAIFGLSEATFEGLREMELGSDDSGDPYRILGVARDADDTEIKAAYRSLVRENHPDRLVGRGLPEEFVAVANEKIAAINAAYDKIMTARGGRR